eukprot:1608172-Amphidinium_carterae.1
MELYYNYYEQNTTGSWTSPIGLDQEKYYIDYNVYSDEGYLHATVTETTTSQTRVLQQFSKGTTWRILLQGHQLHSSIEDFFLPARRCQTSRAP